MAKIAREKNHLMRKTKDELIAEIVSLESKYRTKSQIIEDIELLESRISKSDKVRSATPNNVRFKANSVIYNEGEEGDAVYIILRGQVQFQKNVAGKAPIKLAIIGEAKMFGDCALYDNRPHAASAIALKETEAIRVTKAEFKEQLSTVNPAIEYVANTLTERVRGLVDELVQQRK